MRGRAVQLAVSPGRRRPGRRASKPPRARELREETGATLGNRSSDRTHDWLAYAFSPARAPAIEGGKRGWLGQKQMWFAFRFTGEDGEFDLAGHHQIEFDAWRWAALNEALDLVAPFKLATYRTVVEAFRSLTIA